MQKKKKVKSKKTSHNTKAKAPVRNLSFYLFFGFLIVLLPFVYYPDGLDPALHPRLLFLSILLIPGFGVLFLRKQQSPLNLSVLRLPMFYFMLAYFVITATSTFFAINPLEANYDINKTFAMLSLVFLSSIIFMNTPNWFRLLPILVFIPAITFIITGIWEYYNKVYLSDARFNSQMLPIIYEIRGFMAHKNQFSIAMLMLLPFLGFGVYAFKGFKRWTAILLVLLIFAMIVFLKTRSVWVGFAGATTAIVFLIVFFGNQLGLKKNIRNFIGASFLTLFISLFAVVYFSTPHNPDSIIFKLQRIANPADHNNIYRLQIWELTGKMIQDHPIQGVGAGNWKINSPWYYHGYNLGKDQLNWLRPHNDYLWVFAEKGIFGFLAYAGIFCLALFYLLRIYFSPIERDKKVFSLFMMGGVLSYMAVSFFTFPLERMNQQVYLALFFAATLTLYQEQFGREWKSNAAKWLAIPAVLLLGYSIVYSVSELKMETRVKQARILQERGQWQRMLELSKTIPARFRSIDAEAMPVAWYRGLAYANLQNIQQANLAYQEARIAHPTRIAVLNNLGRTYIQLGYYESARDIFLEALTILPDYFEALVNLSSCYIQLGDYRQAYNYLVKIPQKKMNDPLKANLRFVRQKLEQSGELPKVVSQ